MNLYDLMMGAQGGQGVNTLANQFGISPQQTQAAVQAMMPAFSAGFQKAMSDPMGLGALMTQMANTSHAQAYANPAQAAANATAAGGNVVGQIFGSQQIAQQVSQQAAQASGVSSQIIQQMMPIVASMLIGGVSNAMAAQGMGGLIAQTASQFASNAGLATGGAGATNPALTATNMFGNWMNMVSSLMTGAAGAGTPQAAAMQAGLNTMNSLMQAGVQVSQAQQQGVNDMLAAIGKASKT